MQKTASEIANPKVAARRPSSGNAKKRQSASGPPTRGGRGKQKRSATEKDFWTSRTEALVRREIGFIPNRLFSDPHAHRIILVAEPPPTKPAPNACLKNMPPHLVRLCDTPLLTADQERYLFRRMNYLKFRVNQLRSQLNPRRPNRRKVEQAEQMLGEADRIMKSIVSANTRLVISIVRQLNDAGNSFDELLSDGITSLINAVEKFDFDRGFRFSTYATMVLKRHLFRCMKRHYRDQTRFFNGEPALLSECPQVDGGQRLDEAQWYSLTSTLDTILNRLDARERKIIQARFGFDSQGKKRSLQSIAGDFGVCKERIRQLEKRAMLKLRAWADDFRLDELLDADVLSDIDPSASRTDV